MRLKPCYHGIYAEVKIVINIARFDSEPVIQVSIEHHRDYLLN